MKAVIYERYGPPEGLIMRDILMPTIRDNDVLIKVYATSAHILDTRIRRVNPFLVRLMFGLLKLKRNLVLGHEVSGVVSAIGNSVAKFKPGDEVFALTGFNFGGYAEYIRIPETVKDGTQEWKGVIALKPKNLSFEEAATVPAACLTVLKTMQKANMKKGDKILLYGASGSLGTYAIQLAKYYGAEVTAVCSAKNLELVKSLGADRAIDYAKTDVYAIHDRFDAVYDAVMKLNKAKIKKIMKPNGIYFDDGKLPATVEADLNAIRQLIEQYRINPIIDRIYKIEDIQEARR